MALHKIKDFDPDYRQHFDNSDITGYDLYSGDDKVGSVDDILVDDEGKFRYLVLNTGVWIFGKKVLMPIGGARFDYGQRRVYVDNLTREQVEDLPEYNSEMTTTDTDYDYEERVRGVYRPGMMNPRTGVGGTTAGMGAAGMAAGTAGAANLGRDRTDRVDRTDASATTNRDLNPLDRTPKFDRNTYRYDEEPNLFGMNDRDHANLRLYEERLVANKRRQRTGEVVVNKRVETETQRAEVPLEHERVVVDRTGVTGATPATPGADAFQGGEVARIEVYEEVPDIRKETVVRDQVDIRKEVDRDTRVAEEQVRREELDVRTEGNAKVDRRPDQNRRPDRR